MASTTSSPGVSGGAFAFGPAEIPGRVFLYLDNLYGSSGQFAVLLVVVGIAGAFYLAYRDRAAALTLAFLFAGWASYAIE